MKRNIIETGKANVGYIAESLSELNAENGLILLEELNEEELNPARLTYFRKYAKHNFHDSLQFGYGTEDILDILQSTPPPERWLDLGCGTSTLFWSTAVGKTQEITCVDAAPEALAIQKDLGASGYIPPCYQDAIRYCNRDHKHLDSMRAALCHFWVFDILRPWPEAVPVQHFDLVTAFGSAGISNDPHDFRRTIGQAALRLRPGGALVGANWIRSEDARQNEGYDTSYLTPEFTKKCMLDSGLNTTLSQIISIPDPNGRWNGVLVWCGYAPINKKGQPLV